MSQAMDWTGKQQFMVAEKALKKMSVDDLRQSAKIMYDQLQKVRPPAQIAALARPPPSAAAAPARAEHNHAHQRTPRRRKTAQQSSPSMRT